MQWSYDCEAIGHTKAHASVLPTYPSMVYHSWPQFATNSEDFSLSKKIRRLGFHIRLGFDTIWQLIEF